MVKIYVFKDIPLKVTQEWSTYNNAPCMAWRSPVLTCHCTQTMMNRCMTYFEDNNVGYIIALLRDSCCLQIIMSCCTWRSLPCASSPHFPYLLSMIVYLAMQLLSLLPSSPNLVFTDDQSPIRKKAIAFTPRNSVWEISFCYIRDIC